MAAVKTPSSDPPSACTQDAAGPSPAPNGRDLELARELGARQAGLAVVITARADGTPRASVVNAGILDHPLTGVHVVGFVSRGAARKLHDLRRRPRVTVVFRSAWDWVAVEGDATLVGPDDHLDPLDEADALTLVRTVYAAAVGGNPNQWSERAQLDDDHRAPHRGPDPPTPRLPEGPRVITALALRPVLDRSSLNVKSDIGT